MAATRIRVGILVDHPGPTADSHAIIDWLDRDDRFEVRAVIVQDPGRRGRVRATGLRLMAGLERRVLRPRARAVEPAPAGAPPRGQAEALPAAQLDRIRGLGLDVVVVHAAGPVSTGIASAGAWGSLVVRYGDEEAAGPRVAGFWDSLAGSPTTPFEIRHAGPAGLASAPIISGSVVTQRYFTANHDAVAARCAPYVAVALGRLAGGRPESPVAGLPSGSGPSAASRPVPSLLTQGRYALRTALRLSAVPLRRLRPYGRVEQWNAAFARGSWEDLDVDAATTLANPPGHFLADPFVVTRDGRTVCFVEEYDYAARRGRIAAYSLDVEPARRLGVALAEPFHLSFPFVFEHDGRLFLCPESHERRQVRVYECTSFPLGWQLRDVALDDVAAVDTVIFAADGCWWLLTSTDRYGAGDFSGALEVFRGDVPVGGRWEPLASNPVGLDAARARNGGLVARGGRPCRVAQDPGLHGYGESVVVNEIVRMSGTAFEETPIRRFGPAPGSAVNGLHHLHANELWTVFDYRARSRVWWPARWRARQSARAGA
ncbi:MAG: glucosamine inositolphosphorylceramide transferase family protein [Candidatus Nanopelagicales bacterium]